MAITPSNRASGIRKSPSTRRAVLCAGAPLAALLIAGCAGETSVLEPAGPRAQQAADLTLLMSALAAIVFAIVLVLFLYAVWPRPGSGRASRIGGLPLVLAGGVGLPLLILPVVWFASLAAMSGFHQAPGPQTLEIDVHARQWSYEVRYPASGIVLTDELRIPTGEPVLLRLHSEDVIHSFWVPRLAGKQDMIPGRVNELWIEAWQPGVYAGRCAEFCGIGHAHMEISVVAQEPSAFAAWLEATAP